MNVLAFTGCVCSSASVETCSKRTPRSNVSRGAARPAIGRVRRRRGDVDRGAARRHPGRQPARAGREDRESAGRWRRAPACRPRPAGSRSGRCSRSRSASCRSRRVDTKYSTPDFSSWLPKRGAAAAGTTRSPVAWRLLRPSGSVESKYGLLYSRFAGTPEVVPRDRNGESWMSVEVPPLLRDLPGLLRVLRRREGAAGEHAAPRRHAEAVGGRRVGQRARVDAVRDATPRTDRCGCRCRCPGASARASSVPVSLPS